MLVSTQAGLEGGSSPASVGVGYLAYGIGDVSVATKVRRDLAMKNLRLRNMAMTLWDSRMWPSQLWCGHNDPETIGSMAMTLWDSRMWPSQLWDSGMRPRPLWVSGLWPWSVWHINCYMFPKIVCCVKKKFACLHDFLLFAVVLIFILTSHENYN